MREEYIVDRGIIARPPTHPGVRSSALGSPARRETGSPCTTGTLRTKIGSTLAQQSRSIYQTNELELESQKRKSRLNGMTILASPRRDSLFRRRIIRFKVLKIQTFTWRAAD